MTPSELAAFKSASWVAIRRFNESPSAENAEAMHDAARLVESAQERFRVEHHPNALAVFVLADEERGHPTSIYAVFATGPECVFEAHAEPVAEFHHGVEVCEVCPS